MNFGQKLKAKILLRVLGGGFGFIMRGVDSKIDTPAERRAVAEKFLVSNREKVIDALELVLEKAHKSLDKRGY